LNCLFLVAQKQNKQLSLEETMGKKYLKLDTEQKLASLLKNVKDKERLEASGVVVRGKDILVVMDCMKGIGRLKGQNKKDPLGKGKIVGSQQNAEGYEAITQDPKTGHLFLLIEALKHGEKYQGKVLELDASLDPICTKWLDFDFSSDSKGFEGAAVVRHKGDLLLLALCEGNYCEGGDKGRDTGHGLIQVFKRKKSSWKHIGQIKLPKEVDFEDYADIAIRGKHVAIVSQASSALWVGKVSLSSSKISGKGQVYRFPLDRNDKCVYCNVEGVDWLADNRIIAVSDRMKTDDQPGRCARKDKSIHIMKIPV
jgi:hypothetical protein